MRNYGKIQQGSKSCGCGRTISANKTMCFACSMMYDGDVAMNSGGPETLVVPESETVSVATPAPAAAKKPRTRKPKAVETEAVITPVPKRTRKTVKGTPQPALA